MNNILFLFSSLREANSLIHQSGLSFEKKASNEYIFENIIIYITGIGKNAIEKLDTNYFENVSFIIKAGTCAVLDNKLPLCKPIIPSHVKYRSEEFNLDLSLLPLKISASINTLVSDKTLLTMDKALLDNKKAAELLTGNISFIDMETFFIIEKFKKIPVIPLIVGTDRGDENAKKDFLRILPKASEILKDATVKLIRITA